MANVFMVIKILIKLSLENIIQHTLKVLKKVLKNLY